MLLHNQHIAMAAALHVARDLQSTNISTILPPIYAEQTNHPLICSDTWLGAEQEFYSFLFFCYSWRGTTFICLPIKYTHLHKPKEWLWRKSSVSIFEEVNEWKVRLRRTGLKFDVIVELTSDVYFPNHLFSLLMDTSHEVTSDLEASLLENYIFEVF